MRAMKFGVGQAVRRVEDARFVTGTGRYTSDIYAEGMAQAPEQRQAILDKAKASVASLLEQATA